MLKKSNLARFALVLATSVSTNTHAEFISDIHLQGFLDARLAYADTARSWLDEGLGKGRYSDGNQRFLGQVAELSAIASAKFGDAWFGHAHLKYDDEQNRVADIVEAFLSYRPIPASQYRFKALIGAFFPPISFEHEDIAWTSPYTITPSAINSWIGEEVRTLGAEGTLNFVADDHEWSLSGALFWGNDPAGTLLAWRGWALHDHKVGLLSHVPLPALPIISPGGKLADQAQRAEPFLELDGRPGAYLAFRWEDFQLGEARVLYYDNFGDEITLENGQYAWRTRFVSLGGRLYEFGGMELTAQTMWGNTRMGESSRVNVDFAAAYLMLFKRFERSHLALRLDYFSTDDQNPILTNTNDEQGWAANITWSLPIKDHQNLMLELQYIDSERQNRETLGLPVEEQEVIFQLSYRVVFDGL